MERLFIMSLANKNVEVLLSTGATLVLDAVDYSNAELASFAHIAKMRNAKLVLKNLDSKPPHELQKIAVAGGTNLTFDLTH